MPTAGFTRPIHNAMDLWLAGHREQRSIWGLRRFSPRLFDPNIAYGGCQHGSDGDAALLIRYSSVPARRRSDRLCQPRAGGQGPAIHSRHDRNLLLRELPRRLRKIVYGFFQVAPVRTDAQVGRAVRSGRRAEALTPEPAGRGHRCRPPVSTAGPSTRVAERDGDSCACTPGGGPEGGKSGKVGIEISFWSARNERDAAPRLVPGVAGCGSSPFPYRVQAIIAAK